jgi:ubiquinone/menaquinone biosynthesis C-methylase UbiE
MYKRGFIGYNNTMDFISPKKIIQSLQQGPYFFSPESVVVDFGAGKGTYAELIVPLLGEKGALYVVDIHKDLLKRVRDDISSPLIRLVWADIERPLSSGLPGESVDFVIFSNVLFQLNKKDIALDEAYRILKKGGRFLVTDWDGERETSLVKKDLALQISSLKKEFTERNFLLIQDFDAGAHHFAFMGIKQ